MSACRRGKIDVKRIAARTDRRHTRQFRQTLRLGRQQYNEGAYHERDGRNGDPRATTHVSLQVPSREELDGCDIVRHEVHKE